MDVRMNELIRMIYIYAKSSALPLSGKVTVHTVSSNVH